MENFRGFDRRFFFHARFPVWVKSFIASADYCVLKKPFKKHRSENILLDKSLKRLLSKEVNRASIFLRLSCVGRISAS